MKKSMLLTLATTVLFVGVVYWNVSHRSGSSEVAIRVDPNIFLGNPGARSEPEISGPHLSLPVLPLGWYAHRMSDSSYFVTKQKELPDVGAVESSAYGDSVGVSLATTTRSPQTWVAGQAWLVDEALIRSKVWVDMHGHQALQVQRETEASPALTDFLFMGNLVYTITLYPYPDSKAIGVFNDLLDKYSAVKT